MSLVYTKKLSKKQIKTREKMAKKQAKKDIACHPHGACPCKGLLAILIIVLVWLPSVTATWSKVVITIAAALILIVSGHGLCNKRSKK